jgi:hypothetical protein
VQLVGRTMPATATKKYIIGAIYFTQTNGLYLQLVIMDKEKELLLK